MSANFFAGMSMGMIPYEGERVTKNQKCEEGLTNASKYNTDASYSFHEEQNPCFN